MPIGVADVKRPGRDVTIVACGAQGVHVALQAARQVAREAASRLEVIDLRTLKPLDLRDARRVGRAKTGRLVVVSEGARAGGFASEVVARVVDEVVSARSGRRRERVTAKDTPIPYAASLERDDPAVGRADVVAAIRRTMQT